MVPDVIAFNSLINACGKSKQLKQAQKLLMAMKQEGVVPDVITYSTLISACKNCNLPELAQELYVDMKKQGVVPNIITYNALISGYQLEQALGTFAAMK